MSKAPGNWRVVKLGAIAEDVTVGHVGTMANEYRNQGVPFLRSQNVLPHRFDLTDVRYIDSEFHEKLKKSALHPGDVITIRTGKPGATAVVPDEWGFANCSDVVITRPGNEIDSHWLSYFINNAVAGFINSRLVGAVQQHFNVGSAREMDLLLPPLSEQKAIAEVLNSLGDKIAANQALIKVADMLSLAVTSDTVEHVSLGELVVHKKFTRSPEQMGTVHIAHYSLPAFDDGQIPELSNSRMIKSGKFCIASPSVLISKLNPRFPRVWDIPALPKSEAYASTEFLVLEPKFCSTSVLATALRQPGVSAQLESKVSGTSGSHQRVRPADLLATEILDPRCLGDARLDLISSLGLTVWKFRHEIVSLEETRDALLPRLMSGELRVRDAEKVVEAVL